MTPTNNTVKPETAVLAEEISAIEDPLNPLAGGAYQAATPYISLLATDDSVLRSKGGIEHLKVYRELLRDDQVASCWQQRRLALTSCETVVEPGAEDAASVAAADALREELAAINWDDVTDKALYAVFYGWGVAEVMWRPEGGRVAFGAVRVRERGRFRFGYDGSLHLWKSASGFVKMPDQKFWTCSTGADNHDEPYGLGLAHALFWPVFFKRNDIKFWLTFLEKFGQPTAIARLNAGQINDPAERAKAIRMLRQIATDAGIVAPVDVPIELLEAARSGAADYQGMHDAMNAAIAKIILSQTMTTDNGSSLSQAEVHDGVRRQIVEADADMLCGSFNAGPVKWWAEWNFPGAVPPKVYRHTEPATDQAAQADRDTKIAALGFEPTEDYITKTYGDGWVRKSDPLAMIAGMGQPGDGAQFSEAAGLSLLRAARRQDQDMLAQAAAQFAEQSQSVTGRRVRQVLQAAEVAGDPDLFLRRLDEMLAEAPPRETLDKLTRAGMASRLLGALRGQRRAS